MFGEGSGHPGWSNFDRARAALYAGDRLVGEEAAGWAEFPVEAAEMPYRLDWTQNTAASGAFRVPVTVERAPGSAAAANRLLTAEFSTDDGRTWQTARVSGTGNERPVRVTNPDGPGAVSLRVRATDRAGTTATVEVIRAYLVR